MSFKPYFQLPSGEWATNGQAFATHAEAKASAARRFAVWTAPIGYDARESSDPVNYRFDAIKGDVALDRAAPEVQA